MLRLPLTESTSVLLVHPHYPENTGAAARAAKTMGITRLGLVRPGRLATPENEMAFKMAVRSWDVLGMAARFDDLETALSGFDRSYATSARIDPTSLSPREAALDATTVARAGGRVALVFGNEKTGLSQQDVARCTHTVRIPMAADQPSINLAQAVQIVCYEWFLAAVEAHADPNG